MIQTAVKAELSSLVGGFNPSEKYEITWDDYT